MDDEGDIWEWLRAAGIHNNVVLNINVHQIPLTVGNVVRQIHCCGSVNHADLQVTSFISIKCVN